MISMNGTAAEVVDLATFRQTRGAEEAEPVARVMQGDVLLRPPAPDTTSPGFQEFYPLGHAEDPQLQVAIRILNEGLVRLNEATEILRAGDDIGCDDCLQRLRAILPELFVVGRSIGDGFASVVLATFYCLQNEAGPFSEPQLLALRTGLRRILHAPYVDFEGSLNVQEVYESAGLDPDSRGITELGNSIIHEE
jgi:hypothetical protein